MYDVSLCNILIFDTSAYVYHCNQHYLLYRSIERKVQVSTFHLC